jgi:hypothetical protein
MHILMGILNLMIICHCLLFLLSLILPRIIPHLLVLKIMVLKMNILEKIRAKMMKKQVKIAAYFMLQRKTTGAPDPMLITLPPQTPMALIPRRILLPPALLSALLSRTSNHHPPPHYASTCVTSRRRGPRPPSRHP